MTRSRALEPARTRQLGLMLRRVVKAAHQFEGNKLSPACILHWCQQQYDLWIWAWPCYRESNKRVPPDELSEYKLTHYFLSPCCLCPYLDDSLGYTESKISLLESVSENRNDPERRPFIGEYVAECARQPSCGYFVVLERFYATTILLTKVYPKRDKPYNPNVFNFLREDSEQETLLCGPDMGLRRIFMGDEKISRTKNELKRMRKYFQEDSEPQQIADQFDALYEQGVPASEFWNLFVQCPKCGFVMTSSRYCYAHRCAKRSKTIENKANSEEKEVSHDSQESQSPEVEGDTEENGYERYVPSPIERDGADGDYTSDDEDDLVPDPSITLASMCSGNSSSH